MINQVQITQKVLGIKKLVTNLKLLKFVNDVLKSLKPYIKYFNSIYNKCINEGVEKTNLKPLLKKISHLYFLQKTYRFISSKISIENRGLKGLKKKKLLNEQIKSLKQNESFKVYDHLLPLTYLKLGKYTIEQSNINYLKEIDKEILKSLKIKNKIY